MDGKLRKGQVLFLAFIATVCATLGVAGGGLVVDRTFDRLYVPVDSSGYTMSLTPPSAYDSFNYVCTLRTAELDSAYIPWTSPLQSMIFTVGVITATPTLIDTAAIGLIGCSTVFASAGEIGIEYDPSTGHNATLAAALDSIVDIWNNRVNLKDSIVAQDSNTYIKLVSKHSQQVFEGRWSMQLASAAGAPTDSLDTAGVVTTVAMVCDSMTKAINDDATMSGEVTASDSTTYLLIATDAPSLPFVWIGADTSMDNTGDTATVLIYTTIQDTFDLVQLVHDKMVYNQIYASFVLQASETEKRGYGLSDSGFLWLYTVFNGVYHLLESSNRAALPCTLLVRLPDSADIAHGMDTLFKEMFSLAWRVADTTSDTTMNPIHTIDANWIIKERD